MWITAGDQSAAVGEVVYLVLEILNLVEVGGPVQWSVTQAGATAEVDCVAQAFAESGEVPDSAVM